MDKRVIEEFFYIVVRGIVFGFAKKGDGDVALAVVGQLTTMVLLMVVGFY